jgi:glucokinase
MATMLGVDIGGSKVAAGPVDSAGSFVGDPVVRPTVVRETEAFVEDLLVTIKKARRQGEAGGVVAGIGLACAGTVDQSAGVVVTSPHLPLTMFPLAARVAEATGLPVVLENDANAAVWAECHRGAASGLRHVIMLTLGSGVGGGMVLDGRLIRGAHGAAGELGHVLFEAHGETCRCGARGCLETFLSAKAVERIAFRTVGLFERGAFTGEALGPLARDGELSARTALNEFGYWLGVACANLANIFDPEMIVIGGGLGNLGELILEPARKVVAERTLPPARDQVQLVQAGLGGLSGMIGSGMLAWQELGSLEAGTPHRESSK